MRLGSRISVVAIVVLVVLGCDQKSGKLTLNERCKALLAQELEQDKQNKFPQPDAVMSDFDAFYSEKLSTCVMAQVNPIKHTYFIRDLGENFLKDVPRLFQCDSELHSEANLTRVPMYDGYVANVPYSDWSISDDRSTAGKVKLSPSECQRRFEAMLQRIRQ